MSESAPFVNIKLENEVLRHMMYDDLNEQNKVESDEISRNIGFSVNLGINKEFFQSEFKQALFEFIAQHYIDHSECCGVSTIAGWVMDRYGDDASKKEVINKIISNEFKLNSFKPLAEKLKNKYHYRKLYFITEQLSVSLKDAHENDLNDSMSIAKHVEEIVSPILLSGDKHRVIEEDIFQNLEKDIEELKEFRRNPAKYRGIPSGYKSIDDITGGWKPGELIVVQGRPGTGKSVLLLNFGFHAYYYCRLNVVYVTVEMPIEQQKKRFWSRILTENYGKFRNPERLTDEEMDNIERRLLEEKNNVNANKYWIIDAPENSSASFIESRVTAFENTFGKKVHLLIIDPMYLLQPSNPKTDDPVGVVSWDLKLLARKLNIPVLTASQVNREGGKRQQKAQTASTMDAAFSDKVSNNCDFMINIIADPSKQDMATLQFPKTRDTEKPTNLTFKTVFANMLYLEEIESSDIDSREGSTYTPPKQEEIKQIEAVVESVEDTPMNRLSSAFTEEPSEEGHPIEEFEEEPEIQLPKPKMFNRKSNLEIPF